MKLVYFASVRERIGKSSEDLVLPDQVHTIADLINWLMQRGEEYAHAFEHAKFIRAAIDKKHAQHHLLIGNAQEIAFFPPVTGG